MIDYDTYCRIHPLHQHEHLSVAQIARTSALDPRIVSHWLSQPRFRPRRHRTGASKLDPFNATHRAFA